MDFSDEEGYGKFLDLHHIYTKYCNLKQFQVQLYPTHVSVTVLCCYRKLTTSLTCQHLTECLRFPGRKRTKIIRSQFVTFNSLLPVHVLHRYLEALVDYFLDYLSRSKPLLDQSKVRTQFVICVEYVVCSSLVR